jgi:hypothetical protein
MLLFEIAKQERPTGKRFSIPVGYHVTTKDKLDSIMQHGLQPSSSDAWGFEKFTYTNRLYFFSRIDDITLYRVINLIVGKLGQNKESAPVELRGPSDLGNRFKYHAAQLVLLRVNLLDIPVFLDPAEVKEGIPSYFCTETIKPNRIRVMPIDLSSHYTNHLKQFNDHVNKIPTIDPVSNKPHKTKLPGNKKQRDTTMARIKGYL